MMLAVLHKELEYKLKKAQVQEVSGDAAENQKQIHTKFYGHDWLIQSIIY